MSHARAASIQSSPVGHMEMTRQLYQLRISYDKAEPSSPGSLDAVGRCRRLKDTDVGFVLTRLRDVYKHRRMPLLAAPLACEGGR